MRIKEKVKRLVIKVLINLLDKLGYILLYSMYLDRYYDMWIIWLVFYKRKMKKKKIMLIKIMCKYVFVRNNVNGFGLFKFVVWCF